MNKPFGVILAGGLARRLGGGDKVLIDLDGATLLDHLIERLAPQCSALALNANGDASRFERFGLPVVADGVAGFAGPLAGVLAGLDHAAAAAPEAQEVLTVPGDTPFVPADLAARLQEARAGSAIAVAASGGRRHHAVALWPVSARDALRHALEAEGLRRVSEFIARYGECVVDWPSAPFDPFFNVNAPADVERARRMGAALRGARRPLTFGSKR